MATYKEIKGTQIEAVASDPSNPVEGQVWYNTTSNVVKGLGVSTDAFASGGNTNLARHSMGGTATNTTNALIFGGRAEPPLPKTANTESYNGTSWTEVNNLGTARYGLGSSGTSNTSALGFGGYRTAAGGNFSGTETWNGTNWTEVAEEMDQVLVQQLQLYI